jgi:hypothetical protein
VIDAIELGFDGAITALAEYLLSLAPPAADRNMATSVFVSYSRKDEYFMRRLYDGLEAGGVNIWVDHERLVLGTLDWEHEVRRAIASSSGVIYLGSENAATSEYVRDELTIARDEGIPVYPFWVRGNKWSRCVPLGWGRIQYVDGRRQNFDSAVQSIIASLRKANGGS